MAPGRPRLDPDVKLQHTQDSRRRYDEKNAAERREAARLRMQRCRAAIANSDVITKHKYARKAAEAAENYRYRKHQEQRAEQRAFDAARKKAREAEVLALHKKHTARKPIAASAPLRPIAEPPAVFSKLRDRLQRCSHCYEEDCLGCACMCPDSDEWLEHPDGHFFPTCEGCGRECPGCRCMCPNSTVWKEHGGHLRKKRPVFNSP